jgi:hypothetical protein
MSFAARRQDNDLLVFDASRFAEPEHSQLGKMFAQQAGALRQSQLWNHKEQHATCFKPTIRVFQKYRFQSLIAALPALPIVRRIQVEQRDAFRLTSHVRCVRLKSLDPQGFCLLSSIRVDFDSVAMGIHILK